MTSTTYRYFAVACMIAVAAYIFLALFQPGLHYKILEPPQPAIDSPEYVRALEALVDAKTSTNTSIEVLPNGENFYQAELEAIRAAKHNINLEAYIFQRGKVTREFIDALTERTRAGVKVNLLLDALGSLTTAKLQFKDLRHAGGNVEWYHPFRWYSWTKYNNRTHRELIIIDGTTAFIGGAGFADHWRDGDKSGPRWRDTMFRVKGEAVASLQGTFVDNWLQASGEVLTSSEYFPFGTAPGKNAVLVINSEPSVGGSTRARILFQTLLASAKKTIMISTPYFLPDRSLRAEMVKAIKERHVEITIMTSGKHNDHIMTRRSSRRLYGDLLEAGAHIYEYRPAMLHQKILVVDGVWSVVGSTNMDSRSFGLNDEVNLAAQEAPLAGKLQQLFEDDLKQSDEITYSQWKSRNILERCQELAGWLIERQE